MNLALISLISLVLTIIIGILKPKTNIGIVALFFALFVGTFLAGLKEKEITALFPSNLFVMLLSITVLFGIANVNGTLKIISNGLIRICRGNAKLIPISFFVITFILASIGPGNIAATALIAPVAMLIAKQAKVSPLLMAIMVCTGANAGAFSPIAPTGIILIGLMQKIGISDINKAISIFITAGFIQSISAFLAYIVFKGFKSNGKIEDTETSLKLNRIQIVTIFSILILIISVIFFKVSISVGSITLATILLLLNFADGEKVIKSVPWDAILIVCGVTVLIGVLEKAGGLDLATSIISKFSNTNNINAVLAFITGIVSAYSSSSGVVMPAFIPLVSSLIEKIGGGDIIEMVTAIAIGSHMVDVSPLSTLGAICIACAKVSAEEKTVLFKNLMIWGLSMGVFGSILSYFFLDIL